MFHTVSWRAQPDGSPKLTAVTTLGQPLPPTLLPHSPTHVSWHKHCAQLLSREPWDKAWHAPPWWWPEWKVARMRASASPGGGGGSLAPQGGSGRSRVSVLSLQLMDKCPQCCPVKEPRCKQADPGAPRSLLLSPGPDSVLGTLG